MSLVFGKPGSRRLWGLQRAQITRISELSASVLKYNTKLANRPVHPILWLTPAQIAEFQTIIVTCEQLLAQAN